LSDPRQTRNPSLRHAILPWLAVLVWAALIFYFSGLPNLATDLGIWDLYLRKVAHVAEFAVLSLLLWNAIRMHRVNFGSALVLAAVLAFLYACTDEFHQRYVAGREGTLRDVAIDCVGIIIMGLIIYKMMPKKSQRVGRPVG
jgi:VanZ family protein